MNIQKVYKQLLSFSKRYYVVLSILFILLFIGLIAGYKFFVQKSTYVYVKMKVNQGFWWATTEKPPFWYTQAIKKGTISYDFLNNPQAKILEKRVYLRSDTDAYDIYITVKMKVTRQGNAYLYNRSNVSVGAPLEIQFLNETISGTVIQMGDQLFPEKFVEKTITLQKSNAFLWEYETVQIGDFITDGEKNVFIVLDKNFENAQHSTVDMFSGEIIKAQGTLTIKAKVKVQEKDNTLVLGEERIIKPGRLLNLSLSSYSLVRFVITKIE